jgi:hypothetical protein
VLTLQVSMTIAGSQSMELRRVARDWGEGSSDAGPSSDGDGATSRVADATWIHTFFPDRRWTTPGGDFAPVADAITQVASGAAIWEATGMIARLQEWLDQPATNFGWLVLGNESKVITAKRFGSREGSPAITRPTLTVEFTR